MTNGIDGKIAKLKARLKKLEAKKLEPSRKEKKAIRDATALLMKHGFRVKLVSRKKRMETEQPSIHRRNSSRNNPIWDTVEKYFANSSSQAIAQTALAKLTGHPLVFSCTASRKNLRDSATKHGWTFAMENNKVIYRPPVMLQPEQKQSSLVNRIFGKSEDSQ